uniref:EF-hand domain-containing protein n=1 Tax=Anopheles culicifacies TaxID=139723 RepID=A0A182MS55_9DIPT
MIRMSKLPDISHPAWGTRAGQQEALTDKWQGSVLWRTTTAKATEREEGGVLLYEEFSASATHASSGVCQRAANGRDIDNNGFLDNNDFQCMALRASVIEGKGDINPARLNEYKFIMKSLWDEISALADFDKDGKITTEEFKQAVKQTCVGKPYADFPKTCFGVTECFEFNLLLTAIAFPFFAKFDIAPNNFNTPEMNADFPGGAHIFFSPTEAKKMPLIFDRLRLSDVKCLDPPGTGTSVPCYHPPTYFASNFNE